MALQLRRGTNAQRLSMTPLIGELIFVTDYELVTVSVTAIDAGTDTLTAVAHGLAVNQQIKFVGASLNGLVLNTVYFVKTVPSSDTFTVSLTLGGATVNITGVFTVNLVFATSPTDAAGTPVGTSVSLLYVGDGSTVGGVVSNILTLDDLIDVEIIGEAEGNTLYYDATTGFWRNTAIVTVDDVNNRVGINVASPNFALDISGDVYLSGDLTVVGADIGTGADNVRLQVNRTVASGDAQNTFKRSLLLRAVSAGTPAIGYGPALGFVGQTTAGSSGNFEDAGAIAVRATDLTAASEDFKMTFALMAGGSADQEVMELDSLGNLQIDGDLTVTGNEIKNSAGTSVITFDTNETELIGDLQIKGNKIRNDSGNDTITMATGVTGLVTLSGDLTVTGNEINSSTATALTLSGANVDVAGDLVITGGDLSTVSGSNITLTTSLSTDPFTVVRTSTQTGSTDTIRTLTLRADSTGTPVVGFGNVIEFETESTPGTYVQSGYIQNKATGDNAGVLDEFNMAFGVMSAGASTERMVLDNLGNLQIDGDLTVTGNDIKNSSGTTIITFDINSETEFADAIQIKGNKIRNDSGNDTITMATGVTGLVTLSGNLTVTGNDINSSTATAISLSGADVAVAGDLAVNGVGGVIADITTTQPTGTLFNTTATTVNIGGAATTVAIGANSGIMTIGNPTVVGTQTTQAVFNTVATTVNAFGASTATAIGAATGTTTIGFDLVVTNSINAAFISVDNQATLDSSALTTTATATVALNTTTRNAMTGLINIIQGTDVHCLNFTALKTSASTAMLTTYAEMYDNISLASFSADVSGGSLRLLVTPSSATSTVFSVVRTSLT